MSTETIAPNDTSAATELTDQEIFAAHEGGKLSIASTVPLSNKRDLSIAYTPGVAQVSRAIHANPELAKSHTWAQRLVAVVSDGTAVLGLGNIGASASLPVMEGKSALFKAFGELDSIPLVLNTTDVDEIVETLVRLRPSFGAVNLEDIAAPRCFELEEKLIEALDCPVMHDDQHGTEAGAQPDKGFHDLIDVGGVEDQRDGVQLAEGLEEGGLALHDGQRGAGADVSEAEDGGAVADDGHEALGPGVALGEFRVSVDGPADLGNARRVGDGEVALVAEGNGAGDGKLAALVGSENFLVSQLCGCAGVIRSDSFSGHVVVSCC